MAQFSFSGHETFAMRHGWLKKGLEGVVADPGFFVRDDAMVELGVGKNMVRSIRHWALATRIVKDDTEKYGKLLPTDFGRSIFLDNSLDPFLEDLATLWLLHWQIATNIQRSTTWYWMFNHCSYSEFNLERIAFEFRYWMERNGAKPISDSTLKRDLDCFLRTYVPTRRPRTIVSEDSLDCPLADLRLVVELPDGKTFRFRRGSQDSLPDEIFAFALTEFWDSKPGPENISLSKLVSDPGSPVKVFRLDEDSLIQRLERLESVTDGGFLYDETAGLRQIYRRREINPMRFLEKTYKSTRTRKSNGNGR